MIRTIPFGEYKPDIPSVKNDGLVIAENAVPVNGGYGPFFPMATPSGNALPSVCVGAFSGVDTNGAAYCFAGTGTKLYDSTLSIGNSWTDRSGATTFTATSTGDFWSFTQFDDEVVATNFKDVPVSKNIGSSSDFATLATGGTTAPKARVAGVIGRFLILGDTDDGTHIPSRIQWPGIDDIHDWQTPNSAAARAVQAGEQIFPQEYGPVTAVGSGQLWGLVFQRSAIHKLRYIGGDEVFQIETISRNTGCAAPRSLVEKNGVFYFISLSGVFATDGNTVTPIGDGRVDSTVNFSISTAIVEYITSALDDRINCVLWAYGNGASINSTNLLFYNYDENRFGSALQNARIIFQGLDTGYDILAPWGIGSSGSDADKLAPFARSGTASAATFVTGEAELDEGRIAHISGVRPMVTNYDSSKNPSAITVAIATRNTLDANSPTFGSNTSRTSRTGMCDFRVMGRYASAKVIITSAADQETFGQAVGIQVEYQPGHGV